MFDRVFFPANEDAKVSVERAYRAFQNSLMCFGAAFVKITCLYHYIDANNVIPQQWWDSVIQTCPVYKKSGLFHYFSMSSTGYLFAVPCLYYFRW